MRFSIYLGTNNLDTTSTTWAYDNQIYGDFTHVGRIEEDINQTLSDGTTIIYGYRCNFSNGFWEYTREVTPRTSTWVTSSATCNHTLIPNNTWKHLQLYSTRNVGNVTYQNVCVDGVCQLISQTVNSQFSLSFLPVGNIVINYQLDGDGTSFSTTTYLDQMSISRY